MTKSVPIDPQSASSHSGFWTARPYSARMAAQCPTNGSVFHQCATNLDMTQYWKSATSGETTGGWYPVRQSDSHSSLKSDRWVGDGLDMFGQSITDARAWLGTKLAVAGSVVGDELPILTPGPKYLPRGRPSQMSLAETLHIKKRQPRNNELKDVTFEAWKQKRHSDRYNLAARRERYNLWSQQNQTSRRPGRNTRQLPSALSDTPTANPKSTAAPIISPGVETVLPRSRSIQKGALPSMATLKGFQGTRHSFEGTPDIPPDFKDF